MDLAFIKYLIGGTGSPLAGLMISLLTHNEELQYNGTSWMLIKLEGGY